VHAVEQLNLSAFWALHESDHRARVNCTAMMHHTAPDLMECSVAAFGRQVKRDKHANAAARRVAMLEDTPDVATVRSRLSGLVGAISGNAWYFR
jgi:glycine cleavage system H lipoate-binding protein